MRLILTYACFLPLSLPAAVPLLDATAETAPIPAGYSDSDDAVVWVHPNDPTRSLILGTSKYGKAGKGGLGVYALDGQELQFFSGSKLNSVDLWRNLAIASNRSEKALDFFQIDDGQVSFLSRSLLRDASGRSFEPYGLCLAPGADDEEILIHLPTKSGTLYTFSWKGQGDALLTSTLDLRQQVNAEQDAFMTSIVTKETIAEGDADELDENLEERFVLEGCVHDTKTGDLYVGMENLGIWRVRAGLSELVIPVQGSWTDIDSWQAPGQPRVTDDIEGMDILQRDGQSYLVFSSQGISEFTVYDLNSLTWSGNFQLRLNAADPVTQTDGLAIQGAPLGPHYPDGILVVHDDENTDAQGLKQLANYKIVSLSALKDIFRPAAP